MTEETQDKKGNAKQGFEKSAGRRGGMFKALAATTALAGMFGSVACAGGGGPVNSATGFAFGTAREAVQLGVGYGLAWQTGMRAIDTFFNSIEKGVDSRIDRLDDERFADLVLRLQRNNMDGLVKVLQTKAMTEKRAQAQDMAHMYINDMYRKFQQRSDEYAALGLERPQLTIDQANTMAEIAITLALQTTLGGVRDLGPGQDFGDDQPIGPQRKPYRIE